MTDEQMDKLCEKLNAALNGKFEGLVTVGHGVSDRGRRQLYVYVRKETKAVREAIPARFPATTRGVAVVIRPIGKTLPAKTR